MITETELSGTHVWMHAVYIFQKYLIDGDCGWVGLSSIADVHVRVLGRKETPVKTEWYKIPFHCYYCRQQKEVQITIFYVWQSATVDLKLFVIAYNKM